MRHLVSKVKFNRDTNERKSLIRNLLRDIILHHKVNTTIDKAKWLKREIDKVITHAKKNSVHGLRMTIQILDNKETALALKALLPRLQSRNSGYTRIYRLEQRQGDNTTMASIELIFDEAKAIEKPVVVKKPAVTKTETKPTEPQKPARKPRAKKTKSE